MHIPDGFLDAKITIAAAVLSAGGLGYALYHARRTLVPRQVPLLGLTAAFVFAAQMINFPIIGMGASGHLLGGVLTAALLGPSAAVIVMATVLIVQCLAFADGGITALGANIFNMGILGGALGGMLYLLLARLASSLAGRLFAAIVAAWASVLLAALACTGELASSGIVDWRSALPAMVGIHALIGIGEGVITALIMTAIASVRLELIMQPLTGRAQGAALAPQSSLKPVLVFGLVAALGLALFVSPFACGWPDGLEKVAQTIGFHTKEKTILPAPVPDYEIPGIGSSLLAKALAGGIGTLIVLGGAWLLARALAPKNTAPAPSDTAAS